MKCRLNDQMNEEASLGKDCFQNICQNKKNQNRLDVHQQEREKCVLMSGRILRVSSTGGMWAELEMRITDWLNIYVLSEAGVFFRLQLNVMIRIHSNIFFSCFFYTCNL